MFIAGKCSKISFPAFSKIKLHLFVAMVREGSWSMVLPFENIYNSSKCFSKS